MFLYVYIYFHEHTTFMYVHVYTQARRTAHTHLHTWAMADSFLWQEYSGYSYYTCKCVMCPRMEKVKCVSLKHKDCAVKSVSRKQNESNDKEQWHNIFYPLSYFDSSRVFSRLEYACSISSVIFDLQPANTQMMTIDILMSKRVCFSIVARILQALQKCYQCILQLPAPHCEKSKRTAKHCRTM